MDKDSTPDRHVYDQRPPFILLEHQFIIHIMPQIGSSATCVYLYLIKCSGSFGSCYPSAENIAQNTGLSRRTAIECIKTLKEYGLVSVEPRFRDDGTKLSNRVHILHLPPCADSAYTPTQNLHIYKKIYTEKDVDIYPAKRKVQKTTRTKVEYTTEFESIWSRTWRVGPKDKAYIAWNQLSAQEANDAERELPNWVRYYSTDGVWQKHVVTWINERLWETNIPRVHTNGHNPERFTESGAPIFRDAQGNPR